MSKLLLPMLLLFVLVSCSAKKAVYDDYIFQTKKEKKAYISSYNKSLKLWGVPYKEENIKTRFGWAHVIITGPTDGKEMVLLHGMDASSTMWFPNIKALSKTHRVYAIDFLMEPGKSTLTSSPLSNEEIVVWYNDVFNYYKLTKIDLVAASKGGWVATLLASQKYNSINRLVLLSPAQTFDYVDKVGKMSTAFFLKLFPSEKKFEKTLDAFSTHPDKINKVFTKQLYLANKYSKSNLSMLKMKPFSDEELQAITCPTLVLIGDHDIVNSEKSLEKAKATLTNSTTKVIKDAGHFLSIDQSEDVNKAIISFLK